MHPTVHVVQRVCLGVSVDKRPMVLVDMQGEEEEVIAEDVRLSRGIWKVVRIQIPVGGEEMRVVAVDRGVASPVGPSLDQNYVRIDNIVIKPLRGDEGLDVV